LVPDHGKVGEDLRFASTWARDGVPALAYHWDFGDGTSDEGREVSHTYTMAGSYQVKLVVDGLDGVPAVKNATVEVSGSVTLPPPTRYVPE
jgi:PKD repeat protein